MGLSNDLISQFVKATKDEKETKKESVMYGTVVIGSDGSKQVKLDGSNEPTPVSNTSTIEPGNRVTVMIKNHKAVVTGNLSSPSVGTGYVEEFDRLLAQKITSDELYAETGRIEDLVSEHINASDIRVGDLEADNVEIKEQLTANTADINSLKTSKLDAGVANITYAKIGDLDAAIADIGTLDAGVADIRELMFGSASGDTIQTSFSNTVIGQLGDAQIKSAMIESISADKITAGYINTDNIQVRSGAGYLRIKGDTLQIRDNKGTSRVQIGQDASGDYSINVWDQNGQLMFSKGGITDAAIKEAIIRNDMVSDEANIDAGKLNIDSLFTEINNSTNTIKSSQVYLDNEKQTLDIAFKSLLSEVLDNSYMVSSQGTSIEVLQGYIATKIWQQDIDTAKNELSTQYSTLEQTVDSISTTVASHTSQIANKANNSTITALNDKFSGALSTVNSKVTTLEQNLDGFQTTVSETYATKEVTDVIETDITDLYSTTSNLTKRASVRDGRRYANDTPKYYYTNYPQQTVYEFKEVGSIGLPHQGSGSNANYAYCVLETIVPWTDGSGGFAKQRAITGNKEFWRQGVSQSSWGDWQDTLGRIISAESSITQLSDSITTNVTEISDLGARMSTVEQTASDLTVSVVDAAKTATDYLNFSSSGLVIGDLTASTLGKNALIDTEGFKVRTGTTVNAVFGADIIDLAKDNESATISMLNGAFRIYYDSDNSDGGFGIYGKASDGSYRLALQPVNENGNLTLGWGGYAARTNSTNIYGHKIYLTTNEDIILNPGSGNVRMDGNVMLTNGKNIFGTNTNGANRSMVIMNASNQMVFGYGSYENGEGAAFYDGNEVHIRSRGNIHFETQSEAIVLQDGNGNATYSAFFRPNSNGKCTLGTNANRWYAVYATNATIQTSDIREKENITSLRDIHSELFDKLKPVQYNFIEGNGRVCYGLVAQDVIAAMKELGIEENELDVVHHDTWIDEETKEVKDSYGLAYTNLIAMLIHEVQKLKRRKYGETN